MKMVSIVAVTVCVGAGFSIINKLVTENSSQTDIRYLQGTEIRMFEETRICHVIERLSDKKWLLSVVPPYNYDGVEYANVVVATRHVNSSLSIPKRSGITVLVSGIQEGDNIRGNAVPNLFGPTEMYANIKDIPKHTSMSLEEAREKYLPKTPKPNSSN